MIRVMQINISHECVYVYVHRYQGDDASQEKWEVKASFDLH